MPPAAPARATFHHGDLRRAALGRAREQVVAQGVEKLALRELAAALGVNHRALYRHFPDKQALIQELAAEEIAQLVAAIDAALAAGPEARSPLTLMEVYVGYALEQPRLYEMVFSLPLRNDVDQDTVVGAQVKRLIRLAADVFRHAGDGSTQTRDRVIRAWGTAHGLALLVQRGALRAGNLEATQRYIVEAALYRPATGGAP